MIRFNACAVGWFIGLWVLVSIPEASVYGQTSLTNGLVGYYPFAEDADDQSGNGNHAVFYRAELATNRFGVAFDSFSFTNSYAYIATTNSVGFPLSTNDFTVSFWLRLNSPFYPATDGVLWLFGNKALGQFELSLYPTSGSSGYLSFMIGFNSPTVSTATVQWSPDEWYHLVVRRANNVITIYRNLSMLAQKETTYGNNADPLSRQLIFGNRYINGSFTHSRFQGQLDDIRIYNRALSWPELQELQEYGSGLRVVLVRALKPSFYNLSVGTSYQLQVADGLGNWINQGSPFTATNSMMIYPQYWDVDKWQQLYFRLQVVPQPNN